MEYSLLFALLCLTLQLALAAPSPITIYTSEPIKLEHVPKKEPEPEKPKPVEAIPIFTTAFFHEYTTEKPVKKEKLEVEKEKVETLPWYAIYGPYYGMMAMKPMTVVPKPLPFWYRMKMYYQMFGK